MEKLDAALQNTAELFGNTTAEKLMLIVQHPAKMFWRKIAVGIYHQQKTFIVKSRTFFGARMYVTNYDPYLWFCGVFVAPTEVRLTKYLIKRIAENPSEVIFDVGAHHGFYSLLAHTVSGGAATIYAFEPSDFHFKVLMRNIGHQSHTKGVNAAVYSSEKPLTFFESERTVSTADQAAVDEAKGGKVLYRTVTVPAITLDAFCAREGVVPTFLKIDVEGAEAAALEGARTLLRTHHPDLSLECWGTSHVRETNPVAILMSEGYAPFRITDTGDLTPIQGDVAQSIQGNDCENIIFRYTRA